MDLNIEEKRSTPRTPCNENICFSISNNGALKEKQPQEAIIAKVIDISATGMGIATNAKLGKDLTIQFTKDQPNWELPDLGVIVWCYRHNSIYRAGIEFIAPEGK